MHRRPSSHSPNASMRQPPARNRTPIQHHGTSAFRARSHSRSDLLLAYAMDQGPVSQPSIRPSMVVVPSQSAPTTPQIFPMQSYNLQQETAEGYTDPSSYFPASIPPDTSTQLPDFAFQQTNAQFPGYFPIGRSASNSASAGMPTPNPQETMYIPTQSQNVPPYFPPLSSSGQPFPPVHGMLESTPGELEIMSSRPKPQCWDHGCNGRQFSTFSNLLRHQREKSGSAMKAICPYCGTEFTRTTARNGHMYGGKCKGRADKEPSETSSTPSKDQN